MRPSGRRWLVRTSEAATGASPSADGPGAATLRRTSRWSAAGPLDDLEVLGGERRHDAAVLVGDDDVDDHRSTDARRIGVVDCGGCCAPTRANSTKPAAARMAVRCMPGLTAPP